MTRPSCRAGVAAALLAAVLLAACGSDPAAELPDGTLWTGDAAAARQLLGGVASLAGSPAAHAARRLGSRLAGCERFLAFCPAGSPCSLAERVDCRPAGELVAAADAVRGSAAWLLSHRAGERRLTAWGTPAAAGGLAIRALLREPDAAPQPWHVLLPARAVPAPPVLAQEGGLLRLRLRSDRGAAAFAGLAQGDRAQEMYGLRAEVFTRMALEGTTELTLYEPAPGEPVPPLALAIHVRLRDAAVRGLEAWLEELRTQWPVSRSPWRLQGHEGACLSDLNVLPGLAPCYVATDRALVLGWNQRSVAVALGAAPAPAGDAGSGLELDLARLPRADQRLRHAYGGGETGAVAYPWTSLTVTGVRRGGGYELALRLAGPPAPGDRATAAGAGK